MESAKKEIVESLTPTVRALLEKKLNTELNERSRDQGYTRKGGIKTKEQKQDYSGPHIKATDESTELTLEDALQEFFPADGGVKENADMDKKSSKKSSKKNEALETEAKSSKKSSVKEEIEISEAELRKVYEQALQVEVQVKKGFSDIAKPEEIEQSHKDSGILPKQGEKQFADGQVPAKKDWIPEAKELHAMLQRGLAENKALRENLRKASAMIETLGKKLHEVNLFNAKVLHVNKILNSGVRLTKEQKTFVMETIDKARSIGEVKMLYSTIVESFKTTTAALTEGRTARAPRADAQRARTSGTPKPEVLSESVDRANGETRYARLNELAGLVNGGK